MHQTDDKGYVFTRGGIDTVQGAYKSYCELIKVNREGDPMWTKRFFRGTNLRHITVNTVAKNSENGLVLGTTEFITDSTHIVLVSMDSLGNMLWSKKYPGECKSYAFHINPTSDNGYVVSGSTIDSTHVEHAYIFKINSNGDYVWGKKVLLPNDTRAGFHSSIEIPGEGYLAAGFSGHKALAVKFDLNGNIIWEKNVFTYIGKFYNIAKLSDGSCVFSGSYADSVQAYNPRLCFVKFDASGNILWEKGIQETSAWPYYGSYGWDIKSLANDDIVFSGYVSNAIPLTMVGKLDANGNLLWTKEYRFTFHTFNYIPCSMITTSDGGIAVNVLGGTFTNGASTYSSELLKLDANGYVGCEGMNYALQLQSLNYTSSTGLNIYSCGTEMPFVPIVTNILIHDTTLCSSILDHHPTGLKEIDLSNFDLLQNYPNPSNGSTDISFYLAKTENNVLLEIYDSKGLMVMEKELNEQFEGKQTIHLDLKLSSGIYFYSLIIDGKRKTKCMLVE